MIGELLALLLGLYSQASAECDHLTIGTEEYAGCYLASQAAESQSWAHPEIVGVPVRLSAESNSVLGPGWPSLSSDQRAQISEKQAEFMSSVLEFEQRKQEIYINAYRRQATQSWLVFGLVIIVVVVGVTLSGYQLVVSMSVLRRSIDNSGAGQDAVNQDVTEIGLGEATIKTASIGVAVLFISLAFFYLMLRHVYVLDDQSGPSVPAEAALLELEFDGAPSTNQ